MKQNNAHKNNISADRRENMQKTNNEQGQHEQEKLKTE